MDICHSARLAVKNDQTALPSNLQESRNIKGPILREPKRSRSVTTANPPSPGLRRSSRLAKNPRKNYEEIDSDCEEDELPVKLGTPRSPAIPVQPKQPWNIKDVIIDYL